MNDDLSDVVYPPMTALRKKFSCPRQATEGVEIAVHSQLSGRAAPKAEQTKRPQRLCRYASS
jgi:hypothetical protein